ncbi:hypothetical protein K7B06_00335 [Streptomyces erythrochromogenes]|nr:hypothetical protein [Streptomyces erythrochromogenes]
MAQEQRQSDIRRKSYADLARQFQTLKIKGNAVRNYIMAAQKPVAPGVTEEWKAAQWKKAGEVFNGDFISSVDRSSQTVVAVNLVATDAARDKVKSYEKSRDHFVGLLRGAILDSAPFDFSEFDKTVKECESAIEGFLAEVRDEVI